ncbi:hypothetical protein ThvES_00020080 [Thiovulum sp. ES]|nr:hypothetical protein ThvES_00020080 [Thiovulum sp. ES]
MQILSTLFQKISENFISFNKKAKHITVYTTDSKKALNLKGIVNPDSKTPSYFYIERKGTNSVAFVLYDSSKGYGLLRQWHGALKGFKTGAFTGSLDKNNKSAISHTIEEVEEEAGYKLSEERIQNIGLHEVGANTNEKVYLYLVDISGLEFQGIVPENMWEANTETIWVKPPFTSLHKVTTDWKAILILNSDNPSHTKTTSSDTYSALETLYSFTTDRISGYQRIDFTMNRDLHIDTLIGKSETALVPKMFSLSSYVELLKGQSYRGLYRDSSLYLYDVAKGHWNKFIDKETNLILESSKVSRKVGIGVKLINAQNLNNIQKWKIIDNSGKTYAILEQDKEDFITYISVVSPKTGNYQELDILTYVNLTKKETLNKAIELLTSKYHYISFYASI